MEQQFMNNDLDTMKIYTSEISINSTPVTQYVWQFKQQRPLLKALYSHHVAVCFDVWKHMIIRPSLLSFISIRTSETERVSESPLNVNLNWEIEREREREREREKERQRETERDTKISR